MSLFLRSVLLASGLLVAAQNGPKCPDSNGQSYTAASGAVFRVECDIDHQGGDIASTSANSLGECIAACDSTPGCVDVSLSGVGCYLKGSVGASLNQQGLSGALLVSRPTRSSGSTPAPSSPAGPICPASNNTIYSAPSGDKYLIECGVDHQGGDIGSLAAQNLTACIGACEATNGCVDVSLLGGNCYLKSSVGAPVYNQVWGARLLFPSGATTTITVTSTSSAAATPTSTGLSCPASNGTVYYAPSGSAFVIECDIDRTGGDIYSYKALSLEQCIADCDSDTYCVDVSLSGVACYAKGTIEPANSAPNILGARLLMPGEAASISAATSSKSSVTSSTSSSAVAAVASMSAAATSTAVASSSAAVATSVVMTSSAIPAAVPTSSSPVASTSTAEPNYLRCPRDNNTIYTAQDGETFYVECGIDHPGGDLGLVDFDGSSDVISWFTQCVETCAATEGCVDVSLQGGACYLKDMLEDATNATGVLGARLVVQTPTPTPSPSPTPSPAPTPISPPFVGHFDYQACYNDSVDDRALGGAYMFGSYDSGLTLESCGNFCSNFTYFGVEGSVQCYCGQTLSSTAVETDSCNLPCSGDNTHICGGASAISVYKYKAGLNATSSTNVTYGSNVTLSGNGTLSWNATASATASPVAAANGTSGVFNSTGLMRKHLSRNRVTRHGKGLMNFL